MVQRKRRTHGDKAFRKVQRRVRTAARAKEIAVRLMKEIRWLLHKYATTEGETKEKYLKKIHNWYRVHPREADAVQEVLARKFIEDVGVKKAQEMVDAGAFYVPMERDDE